jgi:hypothetical protein
MIHSRRAEGVTYRCKGRGALLLLPQGGHREIVIHRKVFEKYIRSHVVSWFNWSRDIGLPVERMEDLVFVYGCTLATSWAAAAFDDYTADAQVSLASRALDNGGTSFHWSNIRGTVKYHDSCQLDAVCSPLSTFTRSALIYLFFLVVLKEWSTHTEESMRLHQVLPSKAYLVLDQTPPSRSRTPS